MIVLNEHDRLDDKKFPRQELVTRVKIMSYHISNINDLKDALRPGDVVAFGGNGIVSDVVKFACHSQVSHVGCVLSLDPIKIIESTSLNGLVGVTINLLEDRLNYDGNVWILPLSSDIHRKLNKTSFFNFMFEQNKKPYDFYGAAASALHIEREKFDDTKFFCSELVVAGLEAGGLNIINRPDFARPCDLCAMHIFSGEYYQIVGEPHLIDEYVVN